MAKLPSDKPLTENGKPARAPRVGPLDTISAIRREQARTYRLVNNGKLPADEGTKRTFMLTSIRQSIESDVLYVQALAGLAELERLTAEYDRGFNAREINGCQSARPQIEHQKAS